MSTGDENKQDHQQRNIVLMYYQILRTFLREMYECQEGELVFLELECKGKLLHHLGICRLRVQLFLSPERENKINELRFTVTKN